MCNGVTRTSSHIGTRAIVIGAGISGLAAAHALADHFEEVVVFERDEFSLRRHSPAGRTAGEAGSRITRGRNEGA
jgi:flavin-dependent dehydrogenase